MTPQRPPRSDVSKHVDDSTRSDSDEDPTPTPLWLQARTRVRVAPAHTPHRAALWAGDAQGSGPCGRGEGRKRGQGTAALRSAAGNSPDAESMEHAGSALGTGDHGDEGGDRGFTGQTPLAARFAKVRAMYRRVYGRTPPRSLDVDSAEL